MSNAKNDSILFNTSHDLSKIKEENNKSKLSKQSQLKLLQENQKDQKELDKINGRGEVEGTDIALTVLTGGLYAVFKAISSIVNKVDDEIKDYQINSLKKEVLEEKIAERKEMSGVLGALKQLHDLSKNPSKIEDYQELHAKVSKAIEKSQFVPEDQKGVLATKLLEHKNATEENCGKYYENKMDNAILKQDSKAVKQCVEKLSHIEDKISEEKKPLYDKIKEKIVDNKGQIKMHSKTGLEVDLKEVDGKKENLFKNTKVENAEQINSSNIANGQAIKDLPQRM